MAMEHGTDAIGAPTVHLFPVRLSVYAVGSVKLQKKKKSKDPGCGNGFLPR